MREILGSYTFYVILFFASIFVSLICSWLAIKISNKTGLVDVPGKFSHKVHLKTTPIAGGIALILAILILSPFIGTWRSSALISVLAGTMVIFLFGLLDDRLGLDAPKKLLGQCLAVIVVLAGGISVKFLEYDTFYLGGSRNLYVIADLLLTAFWLIGITNAFNLVDSMDGLAIGLAFSSFAFLSAGVLLSGQSELSYHSIVYLGICLGLLFFNAPPARLFLGDSGAQPLGFLLACFGILYTPQDSLQASSWFLPILLLGVPIFDTSLVFFSRLRRKKPFYKSGLDHTYHRLHRLGLSPFQSVLVINGVAILLDCIAFVALSLPARQANLVFAACLIAGIAAFFYLDNSRNCP